MKIMNFTAYYLSCAKIIIDQLYTTQIDHLVDLLVSLRQSNGRLFILGVGGGAANASHAVSDVRKLSGIQAYAPTDNIAEITAITNDSGWSATFIDWLTTSKLCGKDMVMVFSVGGGNEYYGLSPNIVDALSLAGEVGATICGIVGRNDGYTAQVADLCIVLPTIDSDLITPLTESFQMLLWHLVVTHPLLQIDSPTWEAIAK